MSVAFKFVSLCLVPCVLSLTTSHAVASVITFESAVAPTSIRQVQPMTPYFEAGFAIRPTGIDSAIFGGLALPMLGNPDSNWLGWAQNNVIRFDRVNGAAFSLTSALLGPGATARGPVSITLNAFFQGGATANLTFANLSTATHSQINWTNLIRVDFRTTDNGGLDNLNVPSPSAAALLIFGGLVASRRRRTR